MTDQANQQKKAVLYVFSASGNTAKVARLYQSAFAQKGLAVTNYPVRGDLADLPDPNEYESVGFAYPIHAFNAPKVMLSLAKALPQAAKENKPFFIIKSSGEPLRINNISSLKFCDILRRKGYALMSEYHYVMPYNMIFRHTDTVATKMWDTVQALAPIEAQEVLEGKEHRLRKIAFGRLLAWVMRIEHPTMRLNGRMFRVDYDKCVHCGLCVKACPMQNITMDEDKKLHFAGKCLMCTACSFGCPKNAISIGVLNLWRVNGRYDFDYRGEEQPNKHAWYCKRAYARYFAQADKKVAEAQAKGQNEPS